MEKNICEESRMNPRKAPHKIKLIFGTDKDEAGTLRFTVTEW